MKLAMNFLVLMFITSSAFASSASASMCRSFDAYTARSEQAALEAAKLAAYAENLNSRFEDPSDQNFNQRDTLVKANEANRQAFAKMKEASDLAELAKRAKTICARTERK